VTTFPYRLNALGREYLQLDGHYEVTHHTQPLNRLVREGKLVPVAATDRAMTTTPAFLGGTTTVRSAA
jgi:Fe-S oxidoreductase